MSKRCDVAVVALASMLVCVAVSAGADPLDRTLVPGPGGLAWALEAPRPRPSSLRLVWIDPTGIGAGVEAQACAEAASVLGAMGASVACHASAAGEIARDGDVRVILLERTAERGRGVPVLGATPPRFAVAPFVWVHVTSVRSLMGLRPRGPASLLSPAESRDLARALGRVVAHELVHALAPDVPHGRGLMSASLSRRELGAATIAVDPDVRFAVQAALRGEVPARPGAGVVAAATGREER